MIVVAAQILGLSTAAVPVVQHEGKLRNGGEHGVPLTIRSNLVGCSIGGPDGRCTLKDAIGIMGKSQVGRVRVGPR
jgi:hypothetical protein